MTEQRRLTCEETFRRLNDYLDRALTADEMQLVAGHLDMCAACASEYRFEESVLLEVRAKLQRIDLPRDLLARISAKLADAERNRD